MPVWLNTPVENVARSLNQRTDGGTNAAFYDWSTIPRRVAEALFAAGARPSILPEAERARVASFVDVLPHGLSFDLDEINVIMRHESGAFVSVELDLRGGSIELPLTFEVLVPAKKKKPERR